jgi:hypothetical protein
MGVEKLNQEGGIVCVSFSFSFKKMGPRTSERERDCWWIVTLCYIYEVRSYVVHAFPSGFTLFHLRYSYNCRGREKEKNTLTRTLERSFFLSLCVRECVREKETRCFINYYFAHHAAPLSFSLLGVPPPRFFCVCTVYNKSLCSQHIFLPGLTSSRGYINIHFFISARRECTYCAPHLTRSHHHP